MILLTWDARNAICPALIGDFSQNIGLTPGYSWFCIFLQFWYFGILVFFVLNIFENISKPVGFIKKAINTCFIAKLPSFQENFKL